MERSDDKRNRSSIAQPEETACPSTAIGCHIFQASVEFCHGLTVHFWQKEKNLPLMRKEMELRFKLWKMQEVCRAQAFTNVKIG